jgi:Icc protein
VDTLANLRLALDNVAEHAVSPDVIVTSGDLANGGELDSYRRLRGVLDGASKRFGVPVLQVMGNHDARAPFREGLLGEPASDAAYLLRHLDWRPASDRSRLHRAGAAHGELDQPQLEWLRAELVEPAPEGTLVVLHHPPRLSRCCRVSESCTGTRSVPK